jgi:hypothetical protein
LHQQLQRKVKSSLKVQNKSKINFGFLAHILVLIVGITIGQAQPIIQIAENGNLEQFGFDSTYNDLGIDIALLKSKKSGYWGVYSMHKFNDVGSIPIPFSKPIYDSILVFNLKEIDVYQYFFYREGKVEYSPYLDALSLKKKKIKFEDIRFIPDTIEGNIWSIYLDLCFAKKDGKWGIYSVSQPELLTPYHFDSQDSLSIHPFTFSVNQGNIFIQKASGSKEVYPLPEEMQPESFERTYFPNCTIYYRVRSPKNGLWGVGKFVRSKGKNHFELICSYKFSDIDFELLNGDNPSILGKQNGTWARYHFTKQYAMTKSTYLSKEDVPEIYIDEREHKRELEQKENLGADLIEFDWGNGDGVFKARLKRTKKWGMYQNIGNRLQTMIPAQYDSISFFGWNGAFTSVWNNGKVGIYQSPWRFGEKEAKQTVDCLYDDYKRFNVEKVINSNGYYSKADVLYLAVKKGRLWAWIDWMTGELKTDFLYDIEKEKMPYPEFIQEN